MSERAHRPEESPKPDDPRRTDRSAGEQDANRSSREEPAPREEKGDEPTAGKNLSRRRIGLRACGVGVVAFLVLLAAPWIIANTPLRDATLNWVLPGNRLRITTGGAELGWTSSVRLEDVVLADREKQEFRLEAEELKFDKSWLNLWSDNPDLGELTVSQPRIDIELSRLVPEDVPGEATPVTFKAVLYDTSLRVTSHGRADPVLDLRDFNLRCRVERSPEGPVLYVDPLLALDRYELTPEVCDEGLQLVAPILADVSRVEGSMSVDIENFRMPIDNVDPATRRRVTDIEGQIRLHHVQTGLRNPVIREIVGNLATFAGFEMPSTVRFAENSVVDFHVRNGRVHHEGLSFLLPEVTSDMPWKSTGSVGFDETLDLIIEAPLPTKVLRDSRLADRLSAQKIELRIGGTIDDPKIALPEDPNWLSDLARAILSESDESTADKNAIDQFVDKARAVIETGELAFTLWTWANEWWQGDAEPQSPEPQSAEPRND